MQVQILYKKNRTGDNSETPLHTSKTTAYGRLSVYLGEAF